MTYLNQHSSSTGKIASDFISKQRFHPYSKQAGNLTAGHFPPSSSISNTPNISSLNTSSLISSPLLNFLDYRFHKDYSILICVACEVAWLPDCALGHAKQKHGIKIHSIDQKEWQAFVKEWNITTNTNILPLDKKPVELLKVYADAYCCNLCTYCARTASTFNKHWSTHHKEFTATTEARFHHGSVQTFYSPVNTRYFEIDPSLLHAPADAFAVYLSKEVPNYPPFAVNIPKASREIPPLLAQTQWHVHLEDHIKAKQQRLALLDLVRPPSISKSPMFKLAWNYMNAVSSLARKSSMRIRCLLKEYPR